MSKYFYAKITGDYALFTAPESKGGGEKITYMVPTRQAMQGIVDAIYFKPTFINVVDEIKIINPIETHTIGVRALYNNGKPGLNYFTVLQNPQYLVKYHFEWNENRSDLKKDRNIKKHEAIMERSLKRGGRRDIFLGTREFVGYAESVSEEDYVHDNSCYKGQKLNLGYMFQEFIYPKEEGNLISCYAATIMENGLISYGAAESCPIKNELSTYKFKRLSEIKSVDQEFEELGL